MNHHRRPLGRLRAAFFLPFFWLLRHFLPLCGTLPYALPFWGFCVDFLVWRIFGVGCVRPLCTSGGRNRAAVMRPPACVLCAPRCKRQNACAFAHYAYPRVCALRVRVRACPRPSVYVLPNLHMTQKKYRVFSLFRPVLNSASFGCDDGVAVCAADLAFAYFCFDDFDGISSENHVGDVVLFVSYVVELEDSVVGGTAVCAFAVDAFVSVYEGFVSVALVSVLVYSCLLILGVPGCVTMFSAGLAGGL